MIKMWFSTKTKSSKQTKKTLFLKCCSRPTFSASARALSPLFKSWLSSKGAHQCTVRNDVYHSLSCWEPLLKQSISMPFVRLCSCNPWVTARNSHNNKTTSEFPSIFKSIHHCVKNFLNYDASCFQSVFWGHSKTLSEWFHSHISLKINYLLCYVIQLKLNFSN